MKGLDFEKRSDLYASFFDRAVSGFLLFDKNLKLVDSNRSISRILRVQANELKGKHFNDVSPFTKELNFSTRFAHVLQTGKPMKVKNILTSGSAGRMVLDLYAFKAQNSLGVIIADVTQLNNVISDFNHLLYKLSHDMRSPNSAIRGLVNAAKLDSKDDQTFHRYLGLINKEAQKMDTILTQLNRAVHIKGGSIVVSHIIFDTFVQEVLKQVSFHPNFTEVLTIVNDKTRNHFYCDRHILSTIFENMVDNALKYRKKDRKLSTLTITITDHKNGVNIIFEDNGIGIEAAVLPDIFKLFYRGTSQAKGAGLGLFTVKNSIRVLRGKISVESKEGKGAKFSIFIPSAVATSR